MYRTGLALKNNNLNYSLDDELNEISSDIAPINKADYFSISVYDVVCKDDFVILLCDVLTDAIIKYDNVTNDSNLKNVRAPFFYGCIINIPSKRYLELIFQSNDNEKAYSLTKVHFVQNNSDNNVESFECSVYFAASPFIRAKRGIVFDSSLKIKDKFDFKIPSSYSEKTPLALFNDKLKSKYPMSFDVFDVGQGNYCKINCDKYSLAVDIGIDIDDDHSLFSDAVSSFQSFYGDVIITHTDLDHFLGCIYLNDRVYKECFWMIPIYKLSRSSSRLIKYLLKVNPSKLILIKEQYDSLIYKNNYFQIYRGKNKATKYCNSINSTGLLLLASNNFKVLFSGDCMYNAMPTSFSSIDNIDYLIVPHHGAPLTKDDYLLDSLSKKSNIKTACISYGKYNKYGHPDYIHYSELSFKRYSIEETPNGKINHNL